MISVDGATEMAAVLAGLREAANTARVDLVNATPYAPLVQDERYQAGIHRGRWPTTQAATALAEGLLSTLGNLDPESPNFPLDFSAAFLEIVQSARSFLATAPAPPAGSRYIRTGRLESGWQII